MWLTVVVRFSSEKHISLFAATSRSGLGPIQWVGGVTRGQADKQTPYLHLVPKLRICEVMPTFAHTSSYYCAELSIGISLPHLTKVWSRIVSARANIRTRDPRRSRVLPSSGRGTCFCAWTERRKFRTEQMKYSCNEIILETNGAWIRHQG